MKTKGINNISQEEFPDGIYVIYQDGTCALYELGMSITGTVQYVGLKLGSKSIAIALTDAFDRDVTLVTREDKTVYSRYFNNHIDAISDWNGKENTDHLRLTGLNPRIKLNYGEYIPALGEFLFINLFIKNINEALIYIDGKPLKDFYWTSTEKKQDVTWIFFIGCGNLTASHCVSWRFNVRSVAPFNPTKLLKTK